MGYYLSYSTLWSRGLARSRDKLTLSSPLPRCHSPPMLYDPLITWSSKITWQAKTIINTTTMPMAKKLGRMFTYTEWLLAIKLHGHIIRWSCEIEWQTKNISPLPQCLWPQNLAWWWLTLTDFYAESQMGI